MKRRLALALLLGLVASSAAAQAPTPPDEKRMRGQPVPDVVLIAEDSTSFRLSSLAGKPILLSPIFTSCPNACPTLTASLRDALAKIGEPDVGYHVVTVSFDPRDTTRDLRAYRERLGLPPGWRLAITSPHNLSRLLRAIDFDYRALPEGGFAHPNVVVVLSPSLEVSGYLNGVMYTDTEVRKALERAARDASLVQHYRVVILLAAVIALAVALLAITTTRRRPLPT